MDRREEQNELCSHDNEEQHLKNEAHKEQASMTGSADLPNEVLLEETRTEDEYMKTQQTEPVVDEAMDEQTDIYYQDEAVVAIEQEKIAREKADADTKKAGFWIRFWAYLLDVVIVFSINGIVLTPIAFIRDLPIFEWQVISAVGVLSGLVYYLYFLLMTKVFAQTLGKMVMGIKVISTTNEKLSWGDLFFREVIGRFIHNVFFALKFLYIVVAVTDDKKGVHDIIGNTRVIHVP